MRPSATLQNKRRTLNHLSSHSGGSWTLDSPCILLTWGSNWQSPTCAHSYWRMTFTVLHDLPLPIVPEFSPAVLHIIVLPLVKQKSTLLLYIYIYIYILYILLYTDWLNKCWRNDFFMCGRPFVHFILSILPVFVLFTFQSSLEASPPPGSLPGIAHPCSEVAPPALTTYHHTCIIGWRLCSGLSLSGLWALG